MSIILALVFFTIVITVGYLINRRNVPATEKAVGDKKGVLALKGIFTHPGHTWLEVVEPDLVNVGMDRFTKSVFGPINNIKVPAKGETINQGGKAWSVERDGRQLHQVSPISGKVVEVNQAVLNDTKIMNDRNSERNWILKIEPTKLRKELRNLLYGDMAARWNQLAKEQLVSVLAPAGFPVLQDGGDISPDLGNELPDHEWEKLTKEFFNQI